MDSPSAFNIKAWEALDINDINLMRNIINDATHKSLRILLDILEDNWSLVYFDFFGGHVVFAEEALLAQDNFGQIVNVQIQYGLIILR